MTSDITAREFKGDMDKVIVMMWQYFETRHLRRGLFSDLVPDSTAVNLRAAVQSKKATEDSDAANGDESKQKKTAETFECSAQECVTIKIVHSLEELREGTSLDFHPEFTHQLFGDDETIYGYKKLKIDIWMHAFTFRTFIDCSYESKVSRPKKEVMDLSLVWEENFPGGYTGSRKEFEEWLGDEAEMKSAETMVAQQGKCIKEWTATGGSACTVVEMDLRAEMVRKWHNRLQGLLRLHIDNGQPIDTQDPHWALIITLESPSPTSDQPHPGARLTGFATVYKFYHHPSGARHRISQVLVLPPYQKRGFAWRLLESVRERGLRSADSYDISVEDPSDDLQEIREIGDVIRMLDWEPARASSQRAAERLQEIERGCGEGGGGAAEPAPLPMEEIIRSGWLQDGLAEDARGKWLVGKKQMRRCWEVMTWIHLHRRAGGGGLRAWRRLVTQRIYREEAGGKKEKEAAKGKRVMDMDFVEGGKMMFLMCRGRKRGREGREGREGGPRKKSGVHELEVAEAEGGHGAAHSDGRKVGSVCGEGGTDEARGGSVGNEEGDGGCNEEEQEDEEDEEEQEAGEEEGEEEEGEGADADNAVLESLSVEERAAQLRTALKQFVDERTASVAKVAYRAWTHFKKK